MAIKKFTGSKVLQYTQYDVSDIIWHGMTGILNKKNTCKELAKGM